MPPFPICLFVVFVFGVLLGALVNWATYTFAWSPRPISPWSPPHEKAPQRRWQDRLPIVGWWGLRREAPIHGAGFWVRPMFVELAMGAGLAVLYWWEVGQLGLINGQVAALPGAPPVFPPLAASPWSLHCVFLSHTILIVLMAAASLVDIDEKIIPDEFTVTGTLLGLVLATILPIGLLPHVDFGFQPPPVHETLAKPKGFQLNPGEQLTLEPTTVNAPNGWPPALLAERSWEGLVISLACYALWCFALTPRIWRGRRGVARGLQVLGTRILRELCRPPLAVIGLTGAAGITAVWWYGGGPWVGLSTALVGMVGSGALVWATRIAGSMALRVEAMGFGDVTLMMMVGAFLGWQAGIIIFFVAPFAGLIAGIVQVVLRRDNVIPYGPYLCLGALFVMVRWADVWTRVQGFSALGWLIPAMLLVVMAMLFVMLVLVRSVKRLFGFEDRGYE